LQKSTFDKRFSTTKKQELDFAKKHCVQVTS